LEASHLLLEEKEEVIPLQRLSSCVLHSGPRMEKL
jgi:hypothetical protein